MSPASLKAANAYKTIGVQTQATQHDQYQLVVMMFDTTLECLNRARGALIASDLGLKLENIAKAVRIIQEGLRTSLDLQNGGELAANLANLYDYCVLRLTQANAQNDEKALAEVVELLKPVAEAWRQMRSGNTAQGAEASTSVEPPAEVLPKGPTPTTRRVGNIYGAGLSLVGA